MDMRIVPALAATLALGLIGSVPASAGPAVSPSGLAAAASLTRIDWHPSRRHWDHHYYGPEDTVGPRAPARVDREACIGAIEDGRALGDPRYTGYRPACD